MTTNTELLSENIITAEEYDAYRNIEDRVLNRAAMWAAWQRANYVTRPVGFGQEDFYVGSAITSADEAGVTIEGDEYWNYGGHEHHYFFLPIDVLLGDGAESRRKFLEEQERTRAEIVANSNRIEERDREQYEKLKAKYG